jgi:hypothetical protein
MYTRIYIVLFAGICTANTCLQKYILQKKREREKPVQQFKQLSRVLNYDVKKRKEALRPHHTGVKYPATV